MRVFQLLLIYSMLSDDYSQIQQECDQVPVIHTLTLHPDLPCQAMQSSLTSTPEMAMMGFFQLAYSTVGSYSKYLGNQNLPFTD